MQSNKKRKSKKSFGSARLAVTQQYYSHPAKMSDIEEGTPTNNGQQKERRKIEIKFIENKTRRHVTFSKRKHGIMKKAFELSVLTGTQVLLLVVSETGLVYTFSTPKFEPIVTQQEGRNLIQACLNAPDDEEEDEEEDGDDDDDDDDGNDMQRQQPQQQQPQQQQQVLNAHANSLGHLNQDQVPAGALKQEVKSQLLGGANPNQNSMIQQQQHHTQNSQPQQQQQQQPQQQMSQQQMSQHPRPQQGIPHPQQSQPQQQQQQQQQLQQQQQQQQQQPLTGIHQPHQQAFANAASPYLNAEQNAAYQQYFQEPQQGQY